MADTNVNTIFHSAKQGLIDIKPVELKYAFPYELLKYPLLALAVFLFIYIIYHTLKLRRAKRIVISAHKDACNKLNLYPNSLTSIKDRAEYLAETLKVFLNRKGIKSAIALDSSMDYHSLSLQLKQIFLNIDPTKLESAVLEISISILEIVKALEEIEYTYNKAGAEIILDSKLASIKANIDFIEQYSQSPKVKRKKS